jgi:hypothetical protein
MILRSLTDILNKKSVDFLFEISQKISTLVILKEMTSNQIIIDK